MYGQDQLPRKKYPYLLKSAGHKNSLKEKVNVLLAPFFYCLRAVLENTMKNLLDLWSKMSDYLKYSSPYLPFTSLNRSAIAKAVGSECKGVAIS